MIRDIDDWIHRAATAAFDQPHADNFVYVMRQILTAAWQEGFEAGRHAEDRDNRTARQVNELIAGRGE